MAANQASKAFKIWLRAQSFTGNAPLPLILRRYKRRISHSAAYRVCRNVGLKGRRYNQTRYAEFWKRINWELPDTVLSDIWKTNRGNLRARRARLGIPSPRWRLPRDRKNVVFVTAIQWVVEKSREFRAPRPS